MDERMDGWINEHVNNTQTTPLPNSVLIPFPNWGLIISCSHRNTTYISRPTSSDINLRHGSKFDFHFNPFSNRHSHLISSYTKWVYQCLIMFFWIRRPLPAISKPLPLNCLDLFWGTWTLVFRTYFKISGFKIKFR